MVVNGDSTRQSLTSASMAAGLMVMNLVLKSVIAFAIVSLSIRHLGASEAGLWILLQNVAMYLGLTDMGLAQSVANFAGAAYARDDTPGLNRIISSAFALYWLLVVPVLVAGLVLHHSFSLADWLLREHGTAALSRSFAVALTITIVLTLLRVPLTIFPAILLALRRVVGRQFYEMFSAVSVFVVTVIVLIAGGRLLSLVVATNITLAAVALAVYPWLSRKSNASVALSANHVQRGQMHILLENSLFFFLMGLALLVDRSAGNFLVGRYVSVSAVPAMYLLITIVRVLGWSLVNAVSASLQPYVVMYAAEERFERVQFLARLATCASVAIAVAFFLPLLTFGNDGLKWWLGDVPLPGLMAFAWLGMAMLIDALFQGTVNVLIALNRHRFLAIAAVLRAVLTVGFGTAFAARGADPFEGIALGFFLAAAISQVAVVPFVTQRALALPRASYVRDFLLRPLALIAVGVLCVPLVAVAESFALKLVILGVFGITAAAALWFVVLNQDERSFVVSMARRCSSSLPAPTI